MKIKKNEKSKSYAKSDLLVSVICHDIASPLHVINHSVEELETPNPKQHQQKQGRQNISFAADNIEQIVRNVRCMQSVEKGDGFFQLSPVNLVQVCEHAVENFDIKLEQKRIEVEINHENPPAVKAEDSTLEINVLGNLISNAIKFSKPGSKISLNIATDNDHTTLDVTDQGIGIPSEIETDLFDLNAKTSSPGTQGEKGNGLGLPIVKAILELYGATISYKSKKGEGTTFTIRFENFVI